MKIYELRKITTEICIKMALKTIYLLKKKRNFYLRDKV